jgi:hypothetical protein
MTLRGSRFWILTAAMVVSGACTAGDQRTVAGGGGVTGLAGTTGRAGSTGAAGTTGSAATTGSAGAAGLAGNGEAGTTGGGAAGAGGGSAGEGGSGGGGPAGRGGTSASAGRGGAAGNGTAGSGAAGTGTAGAGGGGRGGAGAPGGGGVGTAGTGGGAGGAGPVHDRCTDPLRLEFVNGEATVSDDTGRATDEFPTLTCGGAEVVPLQGGQIYYRFTARPGREYALRVNAPASYAPVVFYVFPADAPCTVDAIQAACRSEGVTGTRPTKTLSTTLTPFAPRDPGDYIVGVDRSFTRGSPYTLTIFEYCGTSGGTDCKVKGCDLNLGQWCTGNTLSACNADGTTTVTTDCAMTGQVCHRGACVASVVDLIGNTWPTSLGMDAGARGVTLLDFFEVTASRTITQVEIIMVQRKAFALEWRILEATNRAGPYHAIFSTRTMSGGGGEASSETTGPIQVPIVAGRFYAIGVALPAGANYYLQQQAEKTLPLEVSFGRVTSAAVVPSASSTTIDYPAPGTFVIAQRVTTKL